MKNGRPVGIPVLSRADRTLLRLLDGNERFVQGHRHEHTRDERALTLPHQPVAAVLTCVDARVSPDHIFDTRLGEILTLRTPGHVLEPSVIAGVALAVVTLDVPLVVVMSHDECAAVASVCAHDRGEKTLTGALGELPAYLEPVMREEDSHASVEGVTAAHLRRTCRVLGQVPELHEVVKRGELRIAGAHLEFPAGRVHIEC